MKRTQAFTLVEIVISLAIVATGMIAIVGLIPLGLQASRDSAVHTTTAIVLEDVHDRMRGSVLEDEGEISSSPFFYDDQGLFIPTNSSEEDIFRRNYRVEVRLEKVLSQHLPDDHWLDENKQSLRAVVIDLYTPVNPGNGQPMGRLDPDTGEVEPLTSVTYYTSALSGPDWEVIDPTYEPKIEY